MTFYFREAPDPVPEFLSGLRGKNPKVHAFGWTRHSEMAEYEPRMSEVRDFLDQCASNLPSEVTKQWLEERECTLRVYISLHPGHENGAFELSNSTLAQLAAIGATVELDVI